MSSKQRSISRTAFPSACGLLFIATVAWTPAIGDETDSVLPSEAESRFRYATDYPVIG